MKFKKEYRLIIDQKLEVKRQKSEVFSLPISSAPQLPISHYPIRNF
ncbi:hypothetical protein M595_1011 [Lyngbya aestuarii BL J]|uniref:Uncharacterized protein n=1 Tax=Lyngbya aestuarii BL J TaxID=1348334 RepID=U7QM38_9CYAN|nr:hypothetical protein M595_1011 [Lyngbya aestuarii BL J]